MCFVQKTTEVYFQQCSDYNIILFTHSQDKNTPYTVMIICTVIAHIFSFFTYSIQLENISLHFISFQRKIPAVCHLHLFNLLIFLACVTPLGCLFCCSCTKVKWIKMNSFISWIKLSNHFVRLYILCQDISSLNCISHKNMQENKRALPPLEGTKWAEKLQPMCEQYAKYS